VSGAILALDQGTSATKALVVRADGSVAAETEMPVTTRVIGTDGVETDAEELWTSLLAAGKAAAADAGEAISAIALANQGETVLAWRRANGEPLSAAIGWQDRRAARVTDALASHRDDVRALSGPLSAAGRPPARSPATSPTERGLARESTWSRPTPSSGYTPQGSRATPSYRRGGAC
jgi:glycerol kinase